MDRKTVVQPSAGVGILGKKEEYLVLLVLEWVSQSRIDVLILTILTINSNKSTYLAIKGLLLVEISLNKVKIAYFGLNMGKIALKELYLP